MRVVRTPHRAHVARRQCPVCGFEATRDTTICENCKAVVPLEEASQGPLRFVETLLGRRLRDYSAHEIAFFLACIPVFIGPPLAALLILAVKVFQDRTRWNLPEWQWVAGIAAVNIILSVMLWRYAAGEVAGFVASLFDWVSRPFETQPRPQPWAV